MQVIPNILPNFTEKDIASIKFYFEKSRKYNDEIGDELKEELIHHPVFGPLIKMQTKEMQDAQNARSEAMQRAAIYDGKWDEYCKDLIMQGVTYAQMNISYQDWYMLIKLYKDRVIPHMKKDLTNVDDIVYFIEGMNKLLDFAMYGIAEAYFTEKNNIIKAGENQFRAIFESSSDVIVLADKNLTLLNINRIDSPQYKKEDVIGKSVLDFVEKPDDKTEFGKTVENVFKSKEPFLWEGSQIVDGSEKYYSSSISPILDDKGEVINIIFITRDITSKTIAEKQILEMNTILERKVKERTEDLYKTNQELEQFAYVASHDLQEPLRNITNYVGLLEIRSEEILTEENKHFLKVISKSAERMKTLIRELLNFSRVGRNRTVEKVDCQKVLKDVLADMDLLIKENNARIIIENLPVIDGNSLEMKQLFQNLISNAIKFRKKDVTPEIIVKCESGKSDWKFSISDNGIGIPKEFLDKIFLIFQRLHTDSEYAGTGIGLAICKKIIEINEGKMWVNSIEGQGSTFNFTLPRK